MSWFTDQARKLAKNTLNSGGIKGAAANIASGGTQKMDAAKSGQGLNNAMNIGSQIANNIASGKGNPLAPQSAPGNNQQSNYGNPQQGIPALKPLSPNKNGYTPTSAPYGMDQTNPGVNEQFWNQNQNLWTKGAFGAPGQGQQFWNQIKGDYNNASQSLQPQFDKAYDNAQANAVGAANAQAAARGVYGSSKALNNVGNIITDSEANRAGAYTDFALKNAQNQQNAAQTYGGLAFGSEGLGNQQRGLDLSALNSGFSASNVAQNNRGNRVQGAFDNAFRNQGQTLDFLQGQYGGLINNDQDLYTGATNAGPAATQEAVNASNGRRQQNTQDLSTGLSLYGAFGGGSSGGGQNPGYNPRYGGYGRNY